MEWKNRKVSHDDLYHAEIMMESEFGFRFANATGSTYIQFINEIKQVMDEHKARDPEIVVALHNPNGDSQDITWKVINHLKGDKNEETK